MPWIEYEIYVPLGGHGNTEAAKKKLIDEFGGLTDTRHENEGVWKMGGVTFRDDVVIWRVLSDRGRAGEAVIQKVAKQLKTELKQKTILVVKRAVEIIADD